MSEKNSPGVLVVEHQPDLRALLQTILRHHGFRVTLAQCRSDALALVRASAGAIDVVLMNSALPDWPAERAIVDIRTAQSGMPICLLAGETRNGRSRPGLADATVLHKPFEPSELAQVIWGLIRPRDRRSEPRHPPQSTCGRVGAGLEPDRVVESWIGDESSEGLRLRLPEKLGDVGSILSIRAADADAGEPWIPVQIRHIRPEAGQWTAGCQFLHPAARPFV